MDAFLAANPWPEELLRYGRPMERLWHFDLPCTPAALWPYIADTNRLNRALALPEMHFVERDGARVGTARYGGIRATWVEDPWEWVYHRRLESVRRYSEGFAHIARSVFVLEPLSARQTRYYAYFGMVPRGVIGRIWTAFGLRSLAGDYRRVMTAIGAELAKVPPGRPALLQAAPNTLPEPVRAKVTTLHERLRGKLDSAEALDQLVEFVTTGDELDLYRIQVPALALARGLDETQLLRACLHATREGLLEMSWDVVCPHCRGVREEARTLGDIPKMATCEVCEIDFCTDSEDAIEIAFHVHPAIRAIPKRLFCSAEPSSKEHIKVQAVLPPGASGVVQPTVVPGRYRMRLHGSRDYHYLDVSKRARTSAEGREPPLLWRVSQPRMLAARPGADLTLENDSDVPQTFVIESMQWLDLALRPRRLFNMQEFRDLFSEEYLAADVQLAVGAQAILFTDMVGSTRFYAEHGDPDAFAKIKRHFAELYRIVDAHRGAVVKTLGDAIMAAFSSSLDAVRAAAAIHACFHQHREDSPIRLRISINVGPCIAVNLNSNIDYFGGTVNVAAKLQACADAGQIAMSGAVYQDEGVRALLNERNASIVESVYRSVSLQEDVPVFCWSTFDTE